MQSKATTVEGYLRELPEDRRGALAAVRAVILKNLVGGYVERMSYGMIGYAVPHELYPAGYHCDPRMPLPFAGLASQKQHLSLYLCVYGEESERFKREWLATGKRLNMGVGCVRFKRLEDVPLEVVGRFIRSLPVKRFVELYETALRAPRPARPAKKAAGGSASGAGGAPKKAASKKATSKKRASKKVSAKKAGARSTGSRSGARSAR